MFWSLGNPLLLAARSVDGVVHLDFDPHLGLREKPQQPELARESVSTAEQSELNLSDFV